MKTKQEFTTLVKREAKRSGVELDERITAFANIIYLTGAIDALQDETKRQEKKATRRGK